VDNERLAPFAPNQNISEQEARGVAKLPGGDVTILLVIAAGRRVQLATTCLL
jgi:hypothetical protein